MNNRKLQKKIRQAFTNATPDLAESIAVESLFSDKKDAKTELPPSKPVRTPIQFRATAALVASILVVALLIGLIPSINPFIGPNAPDNVTLSTEPTDPDVQPTSPTDETTGPPLKPTPEYAITEENAFNIALEYAGLAKDDLNDYLISGNFQLVFPYYEIVLYTDAYKYYYWIDANYGTVAQLERSYAGELIPDDVIYSPTPDVTAVELAKEDQMIKYRDPAFKSVTATPPYYTVRMSAREYHCKIEVSVAHGVVTNLHMINENFFIVIDDGVNFQLTPIMPHREPMIDFTSEQIKIWLTEGMTYGEVKLLIGEQTSNVSPTPIDEPWYVWYFNEGIYNGMRLEIRFKYPGYDHIDDWYAAMNVPTQPSPDDPDAPNYEDDGSYLSTWLHGMKAVAAIIRNGDETVEVLFGKDWYVGQADPITPPDVYSEELTNETEAFNIALDHAGLNLNDVITIRRSLRADSTLPCYEIVLGTKSHEYVYQVSVRHGIIVSAQRQTTELTDDGLLEITKDDAIRIAEADPMYGNNFRLISVQEPDDKNTDFRIVYQSASDAKDAEYICTVTVSRLYGMVINVDYQYKYQIPLREETASPDNISPWPMPADGSIGMYKAIDIARKAVGVGYNQIIHVVCEERDGIFTVTFTSGLQSYKYYIHVSNGKLLSEQDVLPVPPTSEIGEEMAIDVAMSHLGISADVVENLQCTAIRSDDSAHYYEISFNFDGYNWYFRIGMYSPEILEYGPPV
ncbi:MAG: hypothetical protein E7470_05725 [Ruminococcaceae bacterium]|nr:hypothetical protein [Oscillospiraceae bacterium]